MTAASSSSGSGSGYGSVSRNGSTPSSPVLEVRNLKCTRDDVKIFHDINLTVNQGDVVILQGKSGCGKTTLLKCLSHLNAYEGDILLDGKPPKSYGIPTYRTRVLYVPQRPSLLPGTPRDFLTQILHLNSRRKHIPASKPGERYPSIDIADSWGTDEELWDRTWAELSGGEAQRIALASAVGLNMAEVLLLDEPTSALDAESSALVEKHLVGMLKAKDAVAKALIWITHSAEQGERVGTRFCRIADGQLFEENSMRDIV